MRRAIVIHAVVAGLLLLGLDRLFPVLPVHLLAGLALIVVVALAMLAAVAARPRRR